MESFWTKLRRSQGLEEDMFEFTRYCHLNCHFHLRTLLPRLGPSFEQTFTSSAKDGFVTSLSEDVCVFSLFCFNLPLEMEVHVLDSLMLCDKLTGVKTLQTDKQTEMRTTDDR